MSEENVDIVQEGWDAWLRGDLDGLFATFDRGVVWDTSHFRYWPESAYHGVEGIERFLTGWLEVWDQLEVTVEEVVGGPDGRVVSLITQRGVGRDSGLPLDVDMAMITTVRAGKVVRIESYDSPAEALEAAGLGGGAGTGL